MKPTGYVYFAKTSDGAFIKIGFSIRPVMRVKQFGHLRPSTFNLELIGWIVGSRAMEKEIHKELAEHRDKGEWFRAHPDVLEFISSLKLRTDDIPFPESQRPPHKKMGRPLSKAPMPCGWGCGELLHAGKVVAHWKTCPSKPLPEVRA